MSEPGTAQPLSPVPRQPRVPGLVSVVVPAYNAELSLRRCLDSVLAQAYQPIECIVVNDGSTDGTASIAGEYDGRIVYVEQENRGETAARNRGFELCRGELVTFVDHDDHWHPEFVASCVEFLRAHPAVVAVGTAFEVRSALAAQAEVMPRLAAGQDPPAPFEIDDFFAFWYEHEPFHPGSVVMRGTLLDAAGGQRPGVVLSGDLEYWAHLATFGRWGFIPRVLLFVDGTQVARGGLWKKYYERYRLAPTVEEWESRLVGRIPAGVWPSYERVRGQIATWMIFARVFVGDDAEGLRMARTYRAHLDGRFGKLWRVGQVLGMLSWKPMAVALRVRTRVQYWWRERRLPKQ